MTKRKYTWEEANRLVRDAVITEARRLARNLVKSELKKQGIKISYVEAKEITKAAKHLLINENSAWREAFDTVTKRNK